MRNARTLFLASTATLALLLSSGCSTTGQTEIIAIPGINATKPEVMTGSRLAAVYTPFLVKQVDGKDNALEHIPIRPLAVH